MPETLKVLYTSSFGDYRGGGQRSLELLLDHIKPLGVDPIVVAPERGDFLDRIEKKGIATAVVPHPRLRVPLPVPILRFRRTARRLVLDRQVQLVHTDATRSTLLYGTSVRAPIVYHVRVSHPEPVWLERLLVHLSAAVLCVSEGAEARFPFHNGGKIRMVPNGVDLEAFHPGIAPDPEVVTLRDGPDTLLIGQFAQLIEAKGQHILLEALVRLPGDLRDRCRLLFYGSGDASYERRLRGMAEKGGVADRVHFRGSVEEVGAVIAALDAVALPSFSEGLPRTLLEGAALARPLLASAIPGCADVVKEGINGFLRPAGDPEAWRDGLETLLRHPARAELGDAGRRIVEQRFDAVKVAERIREIYEGLLAFPSGNASV